VSVEIEIPLPWPVEINLSRPAMERILNETGRRLTVPVPPDDSVECELDNFRNLLQNLLERTETKPENFDLIGG
jgi:hypothetical protein